MLVVRVAHRNVDRSSHPTTQTFKRKTLEVHQDGILWIPTTCMQHASGGCRVQAKGYACRWVYDRPLPFCLSFPKYLCTKHCKHFTIFSRHVQEELKVRNHPACWSYVT